MTKRARYEDAPTSDIQDAITAFRHAKSVQEQAKQDYRDARDLAIKRIGEGRAYQYQGYAVKVSEPSTRLVLHEPTARELLHKRGETLADYSAMLAKLPVVPKECYYEIEDTLRKHGVDVDVGVEWVVEYDEDGIKAAVGLGAFKEEAASSPRVSLERTDGGDA